MKRSLVMVVFCFLIFLVSTNAYGAATYDNKKVKEISYPVFQNIVKGLEIGSYKVFMKDMNKNMQKAINEERFLKTSKTLQEKLGSFVSGSFVRYELSYKNKKAYIITFYTAKYTKNEQVNFQIVLERRSGKYYINGLNIY